jgi:hypothetical protein
MKKILIVFCGILLFSICLLNINLTLKNRVAKTSKIVNLNKAMASGELPSDEPAIYCTPDPSGDWGGFNPIK